MTDDSDRQPDPERETLESAAEDVSLQALPVVTPTGIAWGAILIFFGIALVVIFAVQNTDPVPVSFLWMEGEFSLAIVILVTVGVIILLTELAGLSYRRRRRRRRAEKEELRKLRGAS